jgi:hypothetical protein
MNLQTIIFIVFVVVMGLMFYSMLRTPAGVEREHQTEGGRIFSSTRAVTRASPDEVIRLLLTDWSWWNRARAEKMKDLGDGRKEFVFHPVRFLNLIPSPPSFVVRLERVEDLPEGGKCVHATLRGDFEGPAEYSARLGKGGTMIELAWRGAEVRSILRFAPIWLVCAVHCWRERIGMEGLRNRLERQHG